MMRQSIFLAVVLMAQCVSACRTFRKSSSLRARSCLFCKSEYQVRAQRVALHHFFSVDDHSEAVVGCVHSVLHNSTTLVFPCAAVVLVFPRRNRAPPPLQSLRPPASVNCLACRSHQRTLSRVASLSVSREVYQEFFPESFPFSAHCPVHLDGVTTILQVIRGCVVGAMLLVQCFSCPLVVATQTSVVCLFHLLLRLWLMLCSHLWKELPRFTSAVHLHSAMCRIILLSQDVNSDRVSLL